MGSDNTPYGTVLMSGLGSNILSNFLHNLYNYKQIYFGTIYIKKLISFFSNCNSYIICFKKPPTSKTTHFIHQKPDR